MPSLICQMQLRARRCRLSKYPTISFSEQAPSISISLGHMKGTGNTEKFSGLFSTGQRSPSTGKPSRCSRTALVSAKNTGTLKTSGTNRQIPKANHTGAGLLPIQSSIGASAEVSPFTDILSFGAIGNGIIQTG